MAVAGGEMIPEDYASAVAAICEATQSPKDVVYAMLQQCDFNLEEAAQKLIDEPFVEQRARKKDKKKEAGAVYENGHAPRANGAKGCHRNCFRRSRNAAISERC